VIGGLGVLREAFRRGFITDPLAAVAAMCSGGFRVSKRLLEEFQESVKSTGERAPFQ
jgi:predicted nucleic acid-binding protein